MSVSDRALFALLKIYKLTLSPLFYTFGARCRHAPSCSEYAVEALRLHGPGLGSWLALRRLVRCRPGGTSGWDPVPAPGHACNHHHHPADKDASSHA